MTDDSATSGPRPRIVRNPDSDASRLREARVQAAPRKAYALRMMGRRMAGSPYLRPTLAALLGTLAAVGMVMGHRWMGPESVPEPLKVDAGTARGLLGGLAATLVTVIAVLFWIRAAAVQLASSQFSARFLQGYLGDRTQQTAMAFVIGTFAYAVTTVWFVDGSGTGGVPHLAVLAGMLLVLASVLVVIRSVADTSQSMHVSEIADRIATRTVERIRARSQPGNGSPRVARLRWREPPREEMASVSAEDSGWLRWVEEDRLLATLPPNSVVRLSVRVGAFIMEGDALCEIWIPPYAEAPDNLEDAVRDLFDIGSSRTSEHDVDYGIRQLTDVAIRALSPGNVDVTGAEEAVVRTGVVLRELLVRDLPTATRADEWGRWLLRPHDLDPEEFIARAFGRLQWHVARHPEVAAVTLDVLGRLTRVARTLEREREVGTLEELADEMLGRCQEADLSSRDMRALEHRARRRGFTTASDVGGSALERSKSSGVGIQVAEPPS